jgi:hypothetical protein
MLLDHQLIGGLDSNRQAGAQPSDCAPRVAKMLARFLSRPGARETPC